MTITDVLVYGAFILIVIGIAYGYVCILVRYEAELRQGQDKPQDADDWLQDLQSLSKALVSASAKTNETSLETVAASRGGSKPRSS